MPEFNRQQIALAELGRLRSRVENHGLQLDHNNVGDLRDVLVEEIRYCQAEVLLIDTYLQGPQVNRSQFLGPFFEGMAARILDTERKEKDQFLSKMEEKIGPMKPLGLTTESG